MLGQFRGQVNQSSNSCISLLVAAITNYHILSCLKQQKFMILKFYGSEVQIQFHWAKVKVLVRACFLLRLYSMGPQAFCGLLGAGPQAKLP